MINRKQYLSNRLFNKIEGEKPFAYFCDLEKNIFAQKYISNLIVRGPDNLQRLITNQKEIKGEVKVYYDE